MQEYSVMQKADDRIRLSENLQINQFILHNAFLFKKKKYAEHEYREGDWKDV